MKILNLYKKNKKVIAKRYINLHPQLEQSRHKQWNKLKGPFDTASYALNPKWYDGKQRGGHLLVTQVMKRFMASVKKIFTLYSEHPSCELDF